MGNVTEFSSGVTTKDTESKAFNLSQHEIANLREFIRYVKLRKVDLTALPSVNKDT